MKKHLVWLLTVPLLAGCDLDFNGLGGCSYDRDYTDVVSASGMITLRVFADDGDLEVIGRRGLNEVRVRAEACASDRRTVDDVDFRLFRSGSTVELESMVPHRDNAHMNFVVEVPEDMEVVIYHEQGNIDVRNVDYVYIDDQAGHIDVRNVYFDVEIIDGSGHIYVNNVGGSVEIDDGSGDIEVEDVGGDLWVRYDQSGSIRYRNIRGIVDIP